MKHESVWQQFRPIHITLTFEYLNAKFGFPIGKGKLTGDWRKKWEEYKQKYPDVSDETAFVVFGNTFINPILNPLLLRDHHAPTFHMLVVHIIKANPGAV